MQELSLLDLNTRGVAGLSFSDKGTLHSYLPYYDILFSPFRYRSINIFEVGYQHGGSCMLFSLYFSDAKILAIDTDGCVPLPESGRILVDVLDIAGITPTYFDNFIPDIAIDDGSHTIEDQIRFIRLVYPVLREGGMLIVEDIQNIDKQKEIFDLLNIPYTIYDLRHIKGRYDDVFLVFNK